MVKIICRNVAIEETFVSFVEEHEGSTLLDICQQAQGVTSSIIFEAYYSYFTFGLMHNEAVLPFLYSNGAIEWNVPFSEAYLKDFLLTHNIEKEEGIYIESGLPHAGGIGLPDFAVLWDVVTPYVLDILAVCANIGGFIALIQIILQPWKKKKRMPAPHTFFEVTLKEKWNHHQLAEQLRIAHDPEKAKNLLRFLGYQWLPKEQLYYLPKEKIDDAKQLLHAMDELFFDELENQNK